MERRFRRHSAAGGVNGGWDARRRSPAVAVAYGAGCSWGGVALVHGKAAGQARGEETFLSGLSQSVAAFCFCPTLIRMYFWTPAHQQ